MKSKMGSSFTINGEHAGMVLSPMKIWRREWFSLTAIGAILGTSFDTLLIQRKHSLFSSGFLSANPLSRPGEIFGFILSSIVADAATIGSMIGILLYVSYRVRVKMMGRRLVILMLALSPLVLTDFVTYQLTSYLGDTFDLDLMLELVGGNPLEIMVVGFGHVLPVLILFVGIVGIGLMIVWRLIIALPKKEGRKNLKPPIRNILLESVTVFFIGLIFISIVRVRSERFDHGLKRKPSVRLLGHIAEFISDIDGDGYGILRRPADPAPFDGNVFPYAVEIPGNGIDENGVAGDLPIEQVGFTEGAFNTTSWKYKPHILFIMLESFRKDVIGEVYKGKRVTPVLDDLAKQGILSGKVYSHNGYTVQSRYHLFSGSLIGLDRKTSLIDDFKNNGYEVAFFSGQDESFGEHRMPIGLERADIVYDGRSEPHRRYTTFSTPGSLGLPYSVLLEKVKSFLDIRKADRPLFLYLNLYDTHFPYHHDGILPLLNDVVLSQSQIHHDRKRELQSMYLNTVANIDRAIGSVLDEVRDILGEETAVIVISDHGESLFEDDFLGHGYMINDAQTQIPLIVSGLPIVIEEPFAQISLRSAINAALAEIPEEGQGPILRKNPNKRIFQYIGTVARPRQIAFVNLSRRTIYDFRSGLVKVSGEKWRKPSLLTPSEFSDFQHLIYYWENGLLARGSFKDHSSESLALGLLERPFHKTLEAYLFSIRKTQDPRLHDWVKTV